MQTKFYLTKIQNGLPVAVTLLKTIRSVPHVSFSRYDGSFTYATETPDSLCICVLNVDNITEHPLLINSPDVDYIDLDTISGENPFILTTDPVDNTQRKDYFNGVLSEVLQPEWDATISMLESKGYPVLEVNKATGKTKDLLNRIIETASVTKALGANGLVLTPQEITQYTVGQLSSTKKAQLVGISTTGFGFPTPADTDTIRYLLDVAVAAGIVGGQF